MRVRLPAHSQAVVNVGARRPGLIHISQLNPYGPRSGGFVSDPTEICAVGDNVLVKILPRSSEKRLSLRLLKVFPRDQTEEREQQATLRRGETLLPRFTRVDDETVGDSTADYAAIQTAADEEAAWAAREVEEEEDDPFAWAAADAPRSGREEEEDLFEWAAAPSESSSSVPGPISDDGEDDPWAWAAAADSDGQDGVEEPEEDGPDFDDSYFEDKYEQDFY